MASSTVRWTAAAMLAGSLCPSRSGVGSFLAPLEGARGSSTYGLTSLSRGGTSRSRRNTNAGQTDAVAGKDQLSSGASLMQLILAGKDEAETAVGDLMERESNDSLEAGELVSVFEKLPLVECELQGEFSDGGRASVCRTGQGVLLATFDPSAVTLHMLLFSCRMKAKGILSFAGAYRDSSCKQIFFASFASAALPLSSQNGTVRNRARSRTVEGGGGLSRRREVPSRKKGCQVFPAVAGYGKSVQDELQERSKKGGFFSERELLKLAQQMTQAVIAWHERGYVHRNIGLNKFVRRAHDEGLTLLSFGRAAPIGTVDTAGGNASKISKCDENNTQVDPREDIFLLGVAIADSLDNKSPQSQRSSQPRSQQRTQLLSKLLTRMTAEDPSQRPSLDEVQTRIKELLDNYAPSVRQSWPSSSY